MDFLEYKAVTPPFQVEYREQQFHLKSSIPLEEKITKYLENTLTQSSRYKIIGHFKDSPVFSLYQAPLASQVGARALWMRLRRRFLQQRIPSTATIAVNRACQCLCEHCSAVFYNHSSKPDLDFEHLLQALKETQNLGVTQIILLGGEPLLRRDLEKMVSCLNPDLSIFTLFTNGEYLTVDRVKALKEAQVMGVFVSLDALDAKTHDQLRKRPGLFSKALQGIENLLKQDLLVAISSYLNPERVEQEQLDQMLEFGKNLGVHEVTFFDAIPSGRWLKNTEGLLQESDREKIQARVNYYRKQKNYPGISAQSTLTSPKGSAFCFAGNTQFYLTAHGEMCPCDFTPLTVGKFPEESIEKLWEKMISYKPYCYRSKSCRMQDLKFRSRYIDPLLLTETEMPAPLKIGSP